MVAGREGCEKRKSNNEGRRHSCALLRRPTTLNWDVRLGGDGFEISLSSENRFSEKYVQFEIVSKVGSYKNNKQ